MLIDIAPAIRRCASAPSLAAVVVLPSAGLPRFIIGTPSVSAVWPLSMSARPHLDRARELPRRL